MVFACCLFFCLTLLYPHQETYQGYFLWLDSLFVFLRHKYRDVAIKYYLLIAECQNPVFYFLKSDCFIHIAFVDFLIALFFGFTISQKTNRTGNRYPWGRWPLRDGIAPRRTVLFCA